MLLDLRCSLFWDDNAAQIGTYLPTFRDNLSVTSSRVKHRRLLDNRCLTTDKPYVTCAKRYEVLRCVHVRVCARARVRVRIRAHTVEE